MWPGTLLFVLVLCKAKAQSGSECRTPNFETATCISVNDCKLLYDAVNSATDPEDKRFLRESLCGWESPEVPMLCCGTKATFTKVITETKINSKRDLLPDRTTCGFQQDHNKVLGGMNTAPEEFPWVVLLKYLDRFNRVTFGCGGALISERYVLTAGHCISAKKTLTHIRLGEWNLNTTKDCLGKETFQQCFEAVDVEVESIKRHDDYNFDPFRGVIYDIALIRLKNPVEYTNYIRPICLPLASEKSDVGERLWVSGWGATDAVTFQKSAIKQKVNVSVVATPDCLRQYRTRGDISIGKAHLCAGGERGKDACKGDSGGPLMTTSRQNSVQYYVEGIVSFGISCGTELPGVYTRVTEFLGWIENNIVA